VAPGYGQFRVGPLPLMAPAPSWVGSHGWEEMMRGCSLLLRWALSLVYAAVREPKNQISLVYAVVSEPKNKKKKEKRKRKDGGSCCVEPERARLDRSSSFGFG
jgi:hypothetical protein